MEHKTTTAFSTKTSDEGIVETVFAVMGNVDLGNDMIHPGAFSKTFQERGRKVKVLDHHQARSVRDVIGKPLELRELNKSELPQGVLDAYPEATGGAWAKVQFLMDTPEGDGAFKRIKAGVVGEWSFGYDALDHDYSTVKQDGKDVTIRNLRTVKLYELSPVIWGMNDATMTVSAKTSPTEEKPWNIFEQDGQYCVYKVSTQTGRPDGEALGCFDSQEEALAQMRALYANEPEAADKESAPDLTLKEDDMQLIMGRFDQLTEMLQAHLAPTQNDLDAPADPEQAADDTPEDDAAGPDIPPTEERLAMLEQLATEMRHLEVE